MEKFGDEVDWNESILSIISKVLTQALLRMGKMRMSKQGELQDTLDGLLLSVNHALKGTCFLSKGTQILQANNGHRWCRYHRYGGRHEHILQIG